MTTSNLFFLRKFENECTKFNFFKIFLNKFIDIILFRNFPRILFLYRIVFILYFERISLEPLSSVIKVKLVFNSLISFNINAEFKLWLKPPGLVG